MGSIIRFSLAHARTVLLIFTFILCAGYYSYTTISKEYYPDITVPVVVVNLAQQGIAPQDAERLLLRPVELKLQSLDGLKEMQSTAFEGGGAILLEFHAGLDIDKLIADVRQEVDIAKADLPEDADEPLVHEINVSLFPVLLVQLSGDLPVRTLYESAEKLKEKIESIGSILKAPVFGKQNELVEIIINPLKLETYGLSLLEIKNIFEANNVIVKSAALDNGKGSYLVKVPGLIETVEDVQNMPLMTQGEVIVHFKDLAEIKSTFAPRRTFTRDRGVPAVTLEITKRLGENIIETVQQVRDAVAEEEKKWGGKIHVTFAQDESQKITDRINELQNSIISAVLLVMLVMIASLGLRSAILVGLAIPGAFLMGLLVLYLMGLTLNVVVLFGLILSVGMLVDGAIIVAEYADRKMVDGSPPYKAYLEASIRMAWPVITSLTTVIVVFLPLLYWPGLVGEFMRFLPITLIATLTASLLMALIFIPVLGALFGKVSAKNKKNIVAIQVSEKGPLDRTPGFTGVYIKILDRALKMPGKVILIAVALLCFIIVLYKFLGRGVEFFPDMETDKAALLVHARGNLSIEEKNDLVKQVEDRILKVPEFSTIYTFVGSVDNAQDGVIGKIAVEFIDWQSRPHANVVLDDALKKVADIPGIVVEVEKHKSGPSSGKPISLQIAGLDDQSMQHVLKQVRGQLESMDDILDIEDSLPLPGIEWDVRINRGEAQKYGANIALVGNALQMVTGGLKFGTYRPDNSREEVDIVAKFPEQNRHLDQIKNLRIRTEKGLIPLSNFVTITPKQKVGKIKRVNSHRYYKLAANITPGILVDGKITALQEWIKLQNFDPTVEIVFKGEEADKKETGAFLFKAFLVAIFFILLILVTQFNSFFSAALVLSSIVLSTFGVLVGLLVTGQAFGIVMGGLGVIALAGIIVSNNIILIDTFDVLRTKAKTFEERREAILRTGAQRLRPVILTKLTTILGLLPIMLRMDIDFLNFNITFGAPSTEWWVQLSTAIVFGVGFASVLTLIVTPAALMMRENFRNRLKRS